VTVPQPDEIARLTAQLDAATDAARDAYRDTGRLIRLLTVLSVPSPPDELLSQALAVLSETFNADVVCIASVIGDDLLVTAATGLAEDDPTVADGWRLGPAAAEAIVRRQPVATAIDPMGKDVPPSLVDLNLRSVAFVPMSPGSQRSNEMVVLYRSSDETYSTADLYVLASIAQRLRASMEDRERAVAIERLAQSGHLLAPHLDPESLVHTAADLMQRLTNSDDAWMVGISEGMAYRRAHRGPTELTADVPDHLRVTELGAWPNAKQGKPWTSVDAKWAGAEPNRAAMCVPVLRDGSPVALLYATRNAPRPFGGGVVEIATILASYVGAALENSTLYGELRQQATRDPLTGLANRELAEQRINQLLADNTAPFTGVLFCDLDGFKAVNDRLGHEAGDALLQQVALRLQQGLRPADLIARFGGDEFVAVLGQIEGLDQVTAVARRLINALNAPFELFGERVTVSASIGGVLGVRGKTTASAMLRDADAAMYVAKSRGTGVVEVFDDAKSHRSLDRLTLRSALQQALEQNEFEVLYQPIIDLETGRPAAFEALLRWRHPQRGLIPPDVFIPLAEETGDIVPIGMWVMKQACDRLAAWQRLPGQEDLNINVNLSAAQLLTASVSDNIVALMRRAGVDPRHVWLEVTERSHAGEDVTGVAERLRSSGIHFALDDFGSSYSNLAYLKQFPAEALKIDKSFIRGVSTTGTDRSIVVAILAMADSLGLRVIAEGIEQAAQCEAVRALGCRLGQGYLFSPALPADEATQLLADPPAVLPGPTRAAVDGSGVDGCGVDRSAVDGSGGDGSARTAPQSADISDATTH
jgi:diguanylate cyclase (GGDEF)-like protein